MLLHLYLLKKKLMIFFFFQVCRLSGGQLYKYTYFQPDLDGERFLADLKHNLSRPIVFDAIMRVRTSTGVRPVEFFGSFYMENTTDTQLAAINSDMAVACKFELQIFFNFYLISIWKNSFCADLVHKWPFIKVSKSWKQILKFSFEPKNERNFFVFLP